MKYIKEYKEYNKPIIFLDLDGVLRPLYSYIGKDSYGEKFDNKCIEAFRYLIKNTNADIVLSSTWKSSGLSIIKEMWRSRNLPGNVIDITPNEVDIVDSGNAEFYDMVDRGLEIDQWIKINNFKGKYLILDDISDFSDTQLKYFIKTDSRLGLTMENARNGVSLLIE